LPMLEWLLLKLGKYGRDGRPTFRLIGRIFLIPVKSRLSVFHPMSVVCDLGNWVPRV
jgi:hypothetical protein